MGSWLVNKHVKGETTLLPWTTSDIATFSWFEEIWNDKYEQVISMEFYHYIHLAGKFIPLFFMKWVVLIVNAGNNSKYPIYNFQHYLS